MLNELDNSIISFPARVSYVLLDDSDKERFNKYGGWKALGTVEFVPFVNNDVLSPSLQFFAKPINVNLVSFPLVNEVVLVIKSVTYNAQNDEGSFDSVFYYTDILGTFNSVEHNATPRTGVDYTNITGVFKEKGVLKVRKSPGDVLVEGRSKNNIKLGSSIKNFDSVFKSEENSPLLVVTNNREDTYDSKNVVFEDINKDGSSLYFLKGHKVDLLLSSANYASFSKRYTPEEITRVIAADTAPTTRDFVEEEIVPVEKDKKPKNIPKIEAAPDVALEQKKLVNFGKVDDSVPNYAKPVLDMIAYAEGTAGFSKEYDVLVTFKILPGWSPDYKGGHPNVSYRVGNVSSTAAGRYQFLYSTWASNYNNKVFSSANQDTSAYDTVRRRVADDSLKRAFEDAKLGKSFQENEAFRRILGRGDYNPDTDRSFKWLNTTGIWTVWASLPNGEGKYAYGNPEYGSQKSKKTAEYYYKVYLYAVSKY